VKTLLSELQRSGVEQLAQRLSAAFGPGLFAAGQGVRIGRAFGG